MSRWNTGSTMNIQSATVDQDYGVKASFDLETGVGSFAQDVTKFEEQAKRDRERANLKGGHRKFATIPDSIALKIMMDHGLDLHDPLFMHDKDKIKKLKYIMLTEYRDLVINT